jgi:hypothetical protein
MIGSGAMTPSAAIAGRVTEGSVFGVLDRWQAMHVGNERDRWLVHFVAELLAVVVLLKHPRTWREYGPWKRAGREGDDAESTEIGVR